MLPYTMRRPTLPTQHIFFYNKESRDVSFHTSYRQSRGLNFHDTMVVAPHCTANLITPKGALIWVSCGWVDGRVRLSLIRTGREFTVLKQLNTTDFDRCVDDFAASLIPPSENIVYTAHVYKMPYRKTNRGKGFDCDAHRVMMAGGVDLLFIHNLNKDNLMVQLDNNVLTVQPEKIFHFNSSVLAFCVKFLFLTKPDRKGGRCIVETDKFKFLQDYIYVHKEDFLQQHLKNILSS